MTAPLLPKGNIVGGYQTADDSYGGGASYDNVKFASLDGGKTWVPETEELRKEREYTSGFELKNEVTLNYAGFKTMRPGELGLKPLRRPRSLVFPDAEVYSYADLPAEMRVNPEHRWEGAEEASIVQRPNGTLVCVVRVEAQSAGSTANLWITRSTDAGRTW